MRDLIRILNKFSIKICLYLDGHGAKRRLAMTIWVSTRALPRGNDIRHFFRAMQQS
ncbi:hypothetical protein [Rickettsia endosymbiont of Ceutorhynchus obstrictus]|uniref:hypothetical protein n=1 Tax=Rickettsia endosymbiont of Ceutorhynchus obstrictus TaxID=3066249 RepID=UPI003132DDFB